MGASLRLTSLVSPCYPTPQPPTWSPTARSNPSGLRTLRIWDFGNDNEDVPDTGQLLLLSRVLVKLVSASVKRRYTGHLPNYINLCQGMTDIFLEDLYNIFNYLSVDAAMYRRSVDTKYIFYL